MSLGKAAAAAAAIMVASPAPAQTGWRSIGRTQASADASSATITARESGDYREFIICTEGGPARLVDAQVHYRDNRVQTGRIRARIADGACSRAMTVGGRDHSIATLEIGYDPASLQGSRPRLELFVR